MKRILLIFPLIFLVACGNHTKTNTIYNQNNELPSINTSGNNNVSNLVASGDNVDKDTKEALKLIDDLLK